MIDVNGTRYHLLLGYRDWKQCTNEQGTPIRKDTGGSPALPQIDLAWDEQKKEVTLRPELFIFAYPPGSTKHSLDARRGAARDRYQNWYWIAPSRNEILVNSAGSLKTSHFWSACDAEVCEKQTNPGDFRPVDPPQPPKTLVLSGLAVTENHYLIVGTDPAGLLIFDLYGGGAPQKLSWPFVPSQIVPAPGGGVWILNRTARTYWGLDSFFNVVRDVAQPVPPAAPGELDNFQPVGGGNARRAASQPSAPSGFAIAASDPIAIQGVPDGSVLILDRLSDHDFPRIYRYRLGSQLGNPVSTSVILDLLSNEQAVNFRFDAYDFAFVSDYSSADGSGPDRLFLVSAEGKQAFAFHLTHKGDQLQIEMLDEYLPMRLFGGKALVAAGSGVYYDYGDHWIPLLQQSRPRYADEAVLLTSIERPFDGREPDCVWHRLFLDACLPTGTAVEVWSRAANSIKDLRNENWRLEPSPYLRGNGSELSFVDETTGPGRGTWELLLQRAAGRYLQLKLRLTGNGRATPHLRALRIYYPRFSYLEHYLPSIYRDDAESASFLDRFLANPEGFYTELEGKIAVVQMLFDPQSAPKDALDWLASWFGVALDPAWQEDRRRLFLRHAMFFFQWRGTIRGLQLALRLALDPCIDESMFADVSATGCVSGSCTSRAQSKNLLQGVRIVEKFRSRHTPGVVFGDPTEWADVLPVSLQGRWTPDQGGSVLQQRYAQALELAPGTPYPIRKPSDSQTAAAWSTFSQQTLGFIPSASDADAPWWRAFLLHRYRIYSQLDSAYLAVSTSFDDIPVPATLPANKGPLLDWFQFESVVLAMQRTAHRFSVLLPLPKPSRTDVAEQERRRDLAERVVNLEKPAHTIFDVKFYWALFRIGEARLGEDTIIDLGGRSPDLISAMILGRGHLVENYLAGSAPDRRSGRLALGDGGCSTCRA